MEGNSHKCQFCSDSFPDEITLKTHISTHQQEVSNPECLCFKCGKLFTKKTNLNKHLKQHENDKPFTCKECGLSFRNPSQLTLHNNRRKNPLPIKCSSCCASFASEAYLSRHLNQIHGSTEGSQKNSDKMKRLMVASENKQKRSSNSQSPLTEASPQTPFKPPAMDRPKDSPSQTKPPSSHHGNKTIDDDDEDVYIDEDESSPEVIPPTQVDASPIPKRRLGIRHNPSKPQQDISNKQRKTANYGEDSVKPHDHKKRPAEESSRINDLWYVETRDDASRPSASKKTKRSFTAGDLQNASPDAMKVTSTSAVHAPEPSNQDGEDGVHIEPNPLTPNAPHLPESETLSHIPLQSSTFIPTASASDKSRIESSASDGFNGQGQKPPVVTNPNTTTVTPNQNHPDNKSDTDSVDEQEEELERVNEVFIELEKRTNHDLGQQQQQQQEQQQQQQEQMIQEKEIEIQGQGNNNNNNNNNQPPGNGELGYCGDQIHSNRQTEDENNARRSDNIASPDLRLEVWIKTRNPETIQENIQRASSEAILDLWKLKQVHDVSVNWENPPRDLIDSISPTFPLCMKLLMGASTNQVSPTDMITFLTSEPENLINLELVFLLVTEFIANLTPKQTIQFVTSLESPRTKPLPKGLLKFIILCSALNLQMKLETLLEEEEDTLIDSIPFSILNLLDFSALSPRPQPSAPSSLPNSEQNHEEELQSSSQIDTRAKQINRNVFQLINCIFGMFFECKSASMQALLNDQSTSHEFKILRWATVCQRYLMELIACAKQPDSMFSVNLLISEEMHEATTRLCYFKTKNSGEKRALYVHTIMLKICSQLFRPFNKDSNVTSDEDTPGVEPSSSQILEETEANALKQLIYHRSLGVRADSTSNSANSTCTTITLAMYRVLCDNKIIKVENESNVQSRSKLIWKFLFADAPINVLLKQIDPVELFKIALESKYYEALEHVTPRFLEIFNDNHFPQVFSGVSSEALTNFLPCENLKIPELSIYKLLAHWAYAKSNKSWNGKLEQSFSDEEMKDVRETFKTVLQCIRLQKLQTHINDLIRHGLIPLSLLIKHRN